EVPRLRVVQDERRDRRLGIHHESLRQLDADLPSIEELEQGCLVRQFRAGRVAEAVALAAVAPLEAVDHRRLGRIREAPLLAQLPVQPLRRGLRGLDRERLERVAQQILAGVLELLGALAYALAGRRDEERDGILRRRAVPGV